MFGLCGWFRSKRAEFDPNNKHYDQLQKTFSQEEQVMLELIYKDLAARNQQNLLTYENFLLFFGLTGLWGSKLFRQFDQDGRKQITKQQFFYGISQTAKAPHSKKIKLLFNFFKDDEDNGIKFIDFTKMLYNYSRDELKQILLEDVGTIPELNKKISRQTSPTEQHSSSIGSQVLSPLPLLSSSMKSSLIEKQKVIEVNYQQPNNQKENESCFRKNYAKFNEYKDPGTILQVKINDFTYIVNYCNMITLVKEFATNIYNKYNINIKTGIFTFAQFDEWIRTHPKLFQSYFQGFHIDIWSYYEGEPNFLSKFDKILQASMLWENKIKKVYCILIGDMLIIAENYKTRRHPTKVVCLDGLTMREVRDQNGFGIELSHRDEFYTKFSLYFNCKLQMQRNLELFQVYEGDTLHDLYDAHEVIGTGKFSIVYRCTEKETGKSYALKDISIQKMSTQAIATMDNESEVMKVISHPQIIKYKQTIRSKSHIYIIAEYIYGKDLYQYVHKRKKLSEYLAAFIIGKIIEATIYLHSVGIIHRDLKPENIMVMLDKNIKRTNSELSSNSFDQNVPQNIKLIDFGLAVHEYELDKDNNKCLAGTPNYIAPEVILDNKVSFKSDIFSIGSILYYLLCGKLAFAHKDMQQTLLRTVRGEYNIETGVWKNISEEAKDLITRLLQPDADQRIGLEQALNHKWFDIVTKSKESQKQSPFNKFVIELVPLQAEDNIAENHSSSNNHIKLSTVSEVNVDDLMQDEIKKERAKRSRL